MRRVSFCNTTQRTRTGAYCKCLLHLQYTRSERTFGSMRATMECTHKYPPWLMLQKYIATFLQFMQCNKSSVLLERSLPTSSVHCGLMESLLAMFRHTTWQLMRWMDVTPCCLQLHWVLETKTKNFETKTETFGLRSRDQHRNLGKINLNALESRDLGLEITTLPYGRPKPDLLQFLQWQLQYSTYYVLHVTTNPKHDVAVKTSIVNIKSVADVSVSLVLWLACWKSWYTDFIFINTGFVTNGA